MSTWLTCSSKPRSGLDELRPHPDSRPDGHRRKRYITGIAALIESESRGLAIAELSAVSEQLAADVGRLVLNSDGFTVQDYFSLDGNYLVEFDDGRLQILPMPDGLHQAIASVINDLLHVWLKNCDVDGRRKLSPFKVMRGMTGREQWHPCPRPRRTGR
jgi:hypothetical protein